MPPPWIAVLPVIVLWLISRLPLTTEMPPPWAAWPPEMALSWTSTLPPTTWMAPTIDTSLITRLPPVSSKATPELSTILRPPALDPSKVKPPLKLSGDVRSMVCSRQAGARTRSCRRCRRGRPPGAATRPAVVVVHDGQGAQQRAALQLGGLGQEDSPGTSGRGRFESDNSSGIGSGKRSSLGSSRERSGERVSDGRPALPDALVRGRGIDRLADPDVPIVGRTPPARAVHAADDPGRGGRRSPLGSGPGESDREGLARQVDRDVGRVRWASRGYDKQITRLRPANGPRQPILAVGLLRPGNTPHRAPSSWCPIRAAPCRVGRGRWRAHASPRTIWVEQIWNG